jgi:hypothetical protein
MIVMDRKFHRDFKWKVKMANITSLHILEQMFRELFDENLNTFIKTEKERYPELTEKEILINMYLLSEKLKGRKNKI